MTTEHLYWSLMALSILGALVAPEAKAVASGLRKRVQSRLPPG